MADLKSKTIQIYRIDSTKVTVICSGASDGNVTEIRGLYRCESSDPDPDPTD
ncbi:hypothetical protein Hanom_Chr14g01264701 [Helianthus anomalus]